MSVKVCACFSLHHHHHYYYYYYYYYYFTQIKLNFIPRNKNQNPSYRWPVFSLHYERLVLVLKNLRNEKTLTYVTTTWSHRVINKTLKHHSNNPCQLCSHVSSAVFKHSGLNTYTFLSLQRTLAKLSPGVSVPLPFFPKPW